MKSLKKKKNEKKLNNEKAHFTTQQNVKQKQSDKTEKIAKQWI